MIENYLKPESCIHIGFVTKINYEQATILSHDYNTKEANYIPQGAFLIVDCSDQTTSKKSYFLLRVQSITYIEESKLIKTETAQKINSIKNNENYEYKNLDSFTRNKLCFYELNCKILGTFYENNGKIFYGSDAYAFGLSRVYNVYKPINESLEFIVNFIKNDRIEATKELIRKISGSNETEITPFEIGKIRYASTLTDQEISGIEYSKVTISPIDFIKQKTGVFGMTRTGKSNTIKTIIKGVLQLSGNINEPIGQLIYDINGEYANDNDQNRKILNENLYTVDKYNDKENNFSPALNNFYFTSNYGLEIFKKGIRDSESGSNYLNNFMSIHDIFETNLHFILWTVLLYRTGYALPNIEKSETKKKYVKIKEGEIFYDVNEESFLILEDVYSKNFNKYYGEKIKTVVENNKKYLVLSEDTLDKIKRFLYTQRPTETNSTLKEQFETHGDYGKYIMDYLSIMTFILGTDLCSARSFAVSGWQILAKYTYAHTEKATKDYKSEIYNRLVKGKTVIIDLSIGEPFVKRYIEDELMSYILERQIQIFRNSDSCPIINIFIEEAHNVIGKKAEVDSLWPRVAKEGAKYNIALIYATQEPSAIHESILSNTANLIVAHLNNEREINTICQYEDLIDFKENIRRAEDVGLVKLRLISKPYTIPVQINRFE